MLIHIKITAVASLTFILVMLSTPAGTAGPTGAANQDKVIHLLNRITYGPTLAEIEDVNRIGIDAYIDKQLNPESIPLPASLEKLSRKSTLADAPARLYLSWGPPALQQIKNGAELTSKFGTDRSELQTKRGFDRDEGRIPVGDRPWRRPDKGDLAIPRTQGLSDDSSTANSPVMREPNDTENMESTQQMDVPSNTPLGRRRNLQSETSTARGRAPGASRFGYDQTMDGLANSSLVQRKREQPQVDGARPTSAPLQKNPLGEIHKRFYGDINKARLTRAMESPRQLEELMVDFWFNHFNVSFDKGLDHIWTGTYEEHAIRPHAMGKFRDLLDATAHHAAMSFYLDNWQNTAPSSPGARGKLQGLNENYARELLELHTLGVDGGYSQKDVVELARVLTGLGFQRRDRLLRTAAMLENQSGTGFDQSRHDFQDKVLLGHTIHGSGEKEVEEALDLLSKHPSTAKHIAFKLAQYFVADSPPESLVKKMAQKFSTTDGDIKSVLKVMLQSDEFWNPQCYNSKFKTPYKYLVSTLRATDCKLTSITPCVGFLTQSGMPLYKCLTPDGYKNTKSAWLSPDAIVKRINLATAIGVGRWPGGQPNVFDYQVTLPLLGTRVSKTTAEAIESAPQPLRLSLVLGSPEFMMY